MLVANVIMAVYSIRYTSLWVDPLSDQTKFFYSKRKMKNEYIKTILSISRNKILIRHLYAIA